jgi:hypothetical protein
MISQIKDRHRQLKLVSIEGKEDFEYVSMTSVNDSTTSRLFMKSHFDEIDVC